MSKYTIGDLVVLKSGSMRMCVEAASDDSVSVVWCNEGVIGRDAFSPEILNRWEARDETPRPMPRSFDAEAPKPYQRPEGDAPKPYRPASDGPKPYRPAGDGPKPYRPAGDKPFRAGGDGPKPYRPAGDKPYRDGPPKPYRPAGPTDGPPRKTGWDGKPRDKKFFRKDE